MSDSIDKICKDEFAIGGKYLIFRLDERDYGIPILLVNEIIGLLNITPIPKTPSYIKGVINLRGNIIQTIDLRLKLDMQEKAYDVQTCIIIVKFSDNEKDIMGLIVDMVSEVLDIQDSNIEVPLNCNLVAGSNLLSGIGKIKDKVIMLLNIPSIINFEEINHYMDNSLDI